MAKPKKPPPQIEDFIRRGLEIAAIVEKRLHAKLMTPPASADAVFDQIMGMIQVGSLDMARAVFLDDAETRERWNLMRGRLTEEEYARAEGRDGGRANAEGNKRAAGVSHTQERRAARYRELLPLRGEDTLRRMALDEGRSQNAIRQSLKAAGIIVSTSSRRGRR